MSVTRILVAILALQVAPGVALAQQAQDAPAPSPASSQSQASSAQPDAQPAPADTSQSEGGTAQGSATVSPTASPASDGTAQTPAPTGFARFQRDNPLGQGLRALKREGVDLSLDFVDNVAANPIGGNAKGHAESHWVSGGAEVDLGTLIGLSDTTLHVQGAWFSGDSLGRDTIGNSISFQQTWRPVPGPRLTQLNIEHDFGRFSLTAGRGAVNSYFNNSPLNCVFMSNTSCLTAYGGISDIGITAFPNSSWMAIGRYALTPQAYVQLGVFDYNNNLNLAGKDGVDFSLGKGTGALIAGEAGYETTFAQVRLPARYKVGFYLNTDGGTSPYYDANGQSSVRSGQALAQLGGTRAGLYGLVDQTIARASGKSQRNLAAFARVYINVGNTQQLDWFASAGLVKTGTFKGRDKDTIDFIITNTRFSGEEIDYLRDKRAAAGGTGSPHANEIIAELNYGFAALPGLRIMPNIQYAIHPDPIYATSRKTDIPDTVVLGVRIDLKMADFFGK